MASRPFPARRLARRGVLPPMTTATSNTAMSSKSEATNLTRVSSHAVEARSSSQLVADRTLWSVPPFDAWDGPGWPNAWQGTWLELTGARVLPPAHPLSNLTEVPHQRAADVEPEADPPQDEIEILVPHWSTLVTPLVPTLAPWSFLSLSSPQGLLPGILPVYPPSGFLPPLDPPPGFPPGSCLWISSPGSAPEVPP